MSCSFFDTNSSQKPNKKEQVRHANAKTSDKSSYKRSEDRNEEPACRGVGYKWFRRQAAKTYLQTNLTDMMRRSFFNGHDGHDATIVRETNAKSSNGAGLFVFVRMLPNPVSSQTS